jgi:hypothetical protein
MRLAISNHKSRGKNIRNGRGEFGGIYANWSEIESD